MGADIISYADPSGVVEFVGPKTFKEFSGHQTVLLLREVQQLSGGGIVALLPGVHPRRNHPLGDASGGGCGTATSVV